MAACIFLLLNISGISLIFFEFSYFSSAIPLSAKATDLSGGKVSGIFVRLRQNITGKKKARAMEQAIYRSAALLSNYSIIQSKAPKGAIYIIQQLALCSGELKKPFEHMLYYLRMNRTEEALDAFEREAGTPAARDFGSILIQMDRMNPAEQRENIKLLRNKLMQEKITREKRKNETISDLIYIPVLANVMIIMVNFIYIGFYSEQRELFTQLLSI